MRLLLALAFVSAPLYAQASCFSGTRRFDDTANILLTGHKKIMGLIQKNQNKMIRSSEGEGYQLAPENCLRQSLILAQALGIRINSLKGTLSVSEDCSDQDKKFDRISFQMELEVPTFIEDDFKTEDHFTTCRVVHQAQPESIASR